jgi:hypothetical protein
MLSGMLGAGSSAIQIVNGKLLGDRITFDAGSTRYTGRVNGDTMEGTLTSGAGKSEWKASRVRR